MSSEPTHNPAHTIYVGGNQPPANPQSPTRPVQQIIAVDAQGNRVALPNPGSPNQPFPQQIVSVDAQGNRVVLANPGSPNQVLPQQPVFYPIIDVVVEWQRGNFLPGLHCLRYNLIPRDFLDQTGYNVLHHAVSQGAIPILLLVLDYFKIDVNMRSRNDQTALMIACNYGFNEIIRILIERGAQVNEQDNTKFSALLYCVKQGRIPQIAYLLHHKADIQVRDSNGCTVVHWAAYKNNVFLLKLFRRFGLDLNTLDTTGMTPLDRAIQSEGFAAVTYLLENGDGKAPPNMKLDQIPNSDMKELIRKKFYPTKGESIGEKYHSLFQKHSQNITFGLYAVLWLLMMTIYLHAIMGTGFGYTLDLLFFLFSLYFILYSFWYYLKAHSHAGSGKIFAYESLNKTLDDSVSLSTSRPPQAALRMNYEALDRLIRKEPKGTVIHEVESEGFPSFLHELAWQFESKTYKEINRFEEKEYCPDCAIRKPPRSAHVDEVNACVPNFHHYSYTLRKVIDHNNHYLYLVLVLQQQILLSLFLFGVWSAYWDRIENGKIWYVESGYRLLVDYGWTYTIGYVIFCVLSLYNLVFAWIEVYGVVKNVTYYELFHRTDCSYLFKIKQDRRGAYVKNYENPYDLGVKENVKQYVNRIFHAENENESK